LPHPDPADRLIAATAIDSDMTLVTADERMLGANWLATLDASS
jgi:PIN domain nuclease of toxin-antitoxin system